MKREGGGGGRKPSELVLNNVFSIEKEKRGKIIKANDFRQWYVKMWKFIYVCVWMRVFFVYVMNCTIGF